MKRILVVILCLHSITSAINADEMIDSLDYYTHQISIAEDSLNYQDAIYCYNNILRIYKILNGDVSRDTTYAGIERRYAEILSKIEIRDWETALQLRTEASNIYKSSGVNNLEYAKSLEELASSYSSLGSTDEAIILEEEAIIIRKSILDTEQNDSINSKNRLEYANALKNLAIKYSQISRPDKAIEYGNEALGIIKDELGDEHPNYERALSWMALVFQMHDFYEGAVQFRAELTKIKKRKIDTNPLDYVHSLHDLSYEYSLIGDFDKSIQLGQEALDITNALNLTETSDDWYMPNLLSSLLSHLASCFSYLGDYDQAIFYETKALEHDANSFYATFYLSDLASYYALKGNYDEAIRLETNSLERTRESLGQWAFLINPLDLSNLAYYYSEIGMYNKAIPLINESFSLARKTVLSMFTGLTTNERKEYWNRYNSVMIPRFTKILIKSRTPEAASMLYDNIALFAKGLLLSSELEINRLIQESDDDEVFQMLSELLENRQMLNMQYAIPLAERQIDCDSLELIASSLEHKLLRRIKVLGDYTRNLNATWQEVHDKLEDTDIAIEFLSYPENDSTTIYVALTLCDNDTIPILTPLFDEQQLLNASGENESYQTTKADEMIWSPLSSRLEGKTHVYFSASGMLHNIGIEYLPSMEGKDCHRLSSTRELVTHQPSPNINDATIFGGIDYNATYASIKNSEPQYVKDYYAMNIMPGQKRGSFDYRSVQRYGVGPLPGSHNELKDIYAMLKDQHVNCDTLSGNQASEESFKALSGQRKSLLHISTHGIYHTPDEVENLNCHLQRMLIGDDRLTHYEDQSLLRCWLYFAGANLAISDTLSVENKPSAGQDDGILNALEIAQMDLRGLDMVVLSACQTALGDVVQGEGVFGLQRGFKKAGAQSILMSLWEVDDEVTHLFMIEFYRGWTSGMTKTAALRNAQAIVKQKYPDPQHWAAFILLDALD